MKKIDFDLEKFKINLELGISLENIANLMGVKVSYLRKQMFAHKLKNKYKKIYTQEERNAQSKRVKIWLKEKPENHPWRSKDKFQSVPCQKMKEFLTSKNIQFVEEFQPEVGGRHFSIDIAMPDRMVALEINGNQHYGKDGLLKPYYQERHDLLEANGWIVYEIHYSACFNLEKMGDFFTKLELNQGRVEFDYFSYVKKEKIINRCPACSVEISPQSKSCKKHRSTLQPLTIMPTKINWPTPTNMQKLLWQKSTVQISKDLGVSDKAIEKFAKKHGLTKPPRGYWLKTVTPEGIEP